MEDKFFDFISTYIPLREEQKKAIIDLDIFRTYKKGTVFLKEGQLSKAGYFVMKGCIRSYYVQSTSTNS